MAAGQGFKTFVTGEVLTAGDVNGYLMQGINVFANATARDAAITAPAEGQFAFTKDNNSLWYYDGAAWVASGATGDIEGVTAGVGISGGGTSGTVTITNSMATAIDAKGDLVAGTGSDAFSRLAVGTNNQVLVADSSTATGLKWATPAGGKILQVVSASTSTQTIISSTTLTDTTITATITPTASTSKILVLITATSQNRKTASAVGNNARLLRDATTIYDFPNEGWANYYYASLASGDIWIGGVKTITYLDSPATTSATTYKLQAAVPNTSGSASIRFQPTSQGPSQIILMEVGA
jgi:hypothetical protein